MTRAASGPVLRPYQAEALDDVRDKFRSGVSRVLLVSPTGSGKTVMFSSVVSGAMRRGNRCCLILTHRAEIVEQTSEALGALAVPRGLIVAGSRMTMEPVQIASVASLARRLDQCDGFDLIVADEAHHIIANSWQRIINAMPRAKLLGTTATPERLDGHGLGDTFETMVVGPTTAELIEGGYLARYAAFAPTEVPDLSRIGSRAGDFAVDQLSSVMARPVVIGSAVASYERFAIGKRAVAFGVDRAHSMALAQRFTENGHQAVHLDGDTPPDERRRIIKALATGEIKVVTNCGLISEGVDVPAVEAVLLARPTQSVAMYLQQVGRALRISPGKDRALVLDLVGNVGRHGLPDADREWSLEAKPRHQRERSDAPRLHRCKQCSKINRPHAISCTSCGATLVTPLERREIEAELARIDRERIEQIKSMEYTDAMAWAGASEERLRQVALARN